MFYGVLILWLLACVICSLLTHLRQRLLTASCPCVAIGGVSLAAIVYLSGYPTLALMLAAVTLYLWGIIRWSLHKQEKSVTVQA